jgi:biotin carboxyl carrier protein
MRFTAQVEGTEVPVEVRAPEAGRYLVRVGDREMTLDVCRTGPQFLSVIVDGRSYDVGLQKTAGGYSVRMQGRAIELVLAEGLAPPAAGRAESGPARISAPMPGKVVRVLVSPGQAVEAGAPLVVIEAMKMENELRAPRAARVSAVHVRPGQAVEGGAALVELG